MNEIRISVVRERPGRYSRRSVANPADAYALLADRAKRLDREHFWRIDLDARSHVLSVETVSIGTASSSLVHPRETLKGSIVVGACAMILAHNHPSGDATPSPDDMETTRRLVKAGALVGIPVLDHVILGHGSFVSLKDRCPHLFDGRSSP